MGRKDDDCEGAIFRLRPYYYIHVLDKTGNVTRIEIGPKTFVKKDNETVILEPSKMVLVPPRHYCIIKNPIKTDQHGEPVKDTLNQVNMLSDYLSK